MFETWNDSPRLAELAKHVAHAETFRAMTIKTATLMAPVRLPEIYHIGILPAPQEPDPFVVGNTDLEAHGLPAHLEVRLQELRRRHNKFR